MINLRDLFRKKDKSPSVNYNNNYWNYENWNKTGKNIFFLRDTGHPDINIQHKLFDASLEMVNRKNFDLIFSEGFEGMSEINYLNPRYKLGKFDVEKFKEKAITRKGYWGSSEILMIQSMKNKIPFVIWGADNEELLQLSGRYVKRNGILKKKSLTDELSPVEIQELKDNILIFEKIVQDRSDYTVDYIVNKMDELIKKDHINRPEPTIVHLHNKKQIDLVRAFEIDTRNNKKYMRNV